MFNLDLHLLYNSYSEKYYATYIKLVLIPLMYLISLVEIKLLRVFCPLNTDILLYFSLLILILVISIKLLFYLFSVFNRYIVYIEETEYSVYLAIFCIQNVFLQILKLILPNWLSIIISWLNFRIILLMLAPHMFIIIAFNIIVKRREYVTFSRSKFVYIFDAIIFIFLKYYHQLYALFQIDSTIVWFLLMLVIGYFLPMIQYKYGTRFFLPNRWRTIKLQYRRNINEDFDLYRIDESMLPECNLWMQKLHFSSLISNNKSLSKNEGKECYNIYMKTQNGMNLHYFCLKWMITNENYHGLQLYGIDEFDD